MSGVRAALGLRTAGCTLLLMLAPCTLAAQDSYGSPSHAAAAPAATHATCPWFSSGSASQVLDGDVEATFSITEASEGYCKFSRKQGSSNSLEIVVRKTDLPMCPSDHAVLKGIGNEAALCALHGKRGESVKMIRSRVRDTNFTVTLTYGTHEKPGKSSDLLEARLGEVAEQVAGSLY